MLPSSIFWFNKIHRYTILNSGGLGQKNYSYFFNHDGEVYLRDIDEMIHEMRSEKSELRQDLRRRGYEFIAKCDSKDAAVKQLNAFKKKTIDALVLPTKNGQWEIWARLERFHSMNYLFRKKKEELERMMEYDPRRRIIKVKIID